MKSFLRRFILWIANANIYVLVYAAVLIPIGIFIGWSYIGETIFAGDPPETYTAIVLVCCAFISSLGGVIQIARKESPGLMGKPFRGLVPILTGSLWVGICWLLIILIGYYRLGL